MRIDDRVREAHLSHFCPGGLGVPVTGSGPVAVGASGGASGRADPDHDLRAEPGDSCGRCGRPLGAGQDVRRRLSGVAVHATCRP